MEQFWKWLLKADAKALFFASLALLAGAIVWWGVDFARAPKLAATEAAAKPPPAPFELAEFKSIGVIGFVSNQFAPETLIVPVNPFHPPYEEIVKALINQSENGVITIKDKNNKFVKVHFENSVLVDSEGTPVDAPFQRDTTPRQSGQTRQQQAQGSPSQQRWAPQQNVQPQPKTEATSQEPTPQLSFKGMMQRPDGSVAAYISIKTDKTRGRFVKVGDKLGNATVTASGRDGIELSFDDGTKTTIGIGDAPVTLEPDNRHE